MQAFAKAGEIFRRVFGVAEMRQEQPRGFAAENGGERFVPDFQVDVWRRGGRQDERAVVDVNATGVADESDAIGVVEVANVVRSMAGRVFDVDGSVAKRYVFAAFEDAQIFRRHWESVAEERRKTVAPEAACTSEQFGRVNQVRGALTVHVNG